MSHNFRHLNLLLLILISISLCMVSSRPIATDPEDHITGTPSATTLTITSSGGEKFEVKLPVAMKSETIRQRIVDGGFSGEMVISFANITGETMAKVLEYCDKHLYYDGAGNNITAVDEMKAFDTQFVDVHYETLFQLVLAANDLKIKQLLDLVGGRIGNMMKGKTPEEIRKMFNVNKNSCVDHAAEKEYVQNNAWAFD